VTTRLQIVPPASTRPYPDGWHCPTSKRGTVVASANAFGTRHKVQENRRTGSTVNTLQDRQGYCVCQMYPLPFLAPAKGIATTSPNRAQTLPSEAVDTLAGSQKGTFLDYLFLKSFDTRN
jgi:hypothetical protein